jgi:hypothetical protein
MANELVAIMQKTPLHSLATHTKLPKSLNSYESSNHFPTLHLNLLLELQR